LGNRTAPGRFSVKQPAGNVRATPDAGVGAEPYEPGGV
jgi:hypothetical protein